MVIKDPFRFCVQSSLEAIKEQIFMTQAAAPGMDQKVISRQ